MNWAELLAELATLPGLSGHEEPVSAFMRKRLRPFANELVTDRCGNVSATIRGTDPAAPSVMVFAHMDQLGFVVRNIEASGFLRLERLGGVPEKTLPGTYVLVVGASDNVVHGVIGNKSHHVTPQDEKYEVTRYGDLYVDIGVSSRQEVLELGIDIGSPVVYRGQVQPLRNRRIAGTALDNRAGCAILIHLAELLASHRPAATTHLVATVQEEFNLRGALVAARTLKPDLAICLDIAIASDTPDLGDRYGIVLGGGPVLSLYNFHGRGTLNGTIPPKKLVALFTETASQNKLLVQKAAVTGILTDASYVQLANNGIPTLDLGFPLRYSHSPIEVCHLDDLDGMTQLLNLVLHALEPGIVLDRSHQNGE